MSAFRYLGYDIDHRSGRLVCRYALDDLTFVEHITVIGGGSFSVDGADVDPTSVDAAARLVYLLAGVSYYKAAAPLVIEVEAGLAPTERDLLGAFYLDGLGEFAYRNGLDLSGLVIEAPDRPAVATGAPTDNNRVLVPFGGGVDSIVTVDLVRGSSADVALFVVSREGDRFDAIESAAAVTGLPVVRAERRLDEQILRSAELGFLNGHVPVTGIISAIAVLAAVLDDRGTVVMSNEWSASSGNVEHLGRQVNHQWSKSLEFEDLFRAALTETVPTPVDYFSMLRPFSELWVSKRFATLTEFHGSFRSCNRAFHLDRAQRLDRWCGRCDKCCFIDLILAPFMSASELRSVFDGHEPLDDLDLVDQFRTLAGLSDAAKPFECVGVVDECRVALLMAAARADRTDTAVLKALSAETARLVPGAVDAHTERLLRPHGPHRIPDSYAPDDLLG